jgi:hypothetical protein
MYHVISITVEPLKTWTYLSYGPFCLSQLESPRNISIHLCPIHEQESKERQQVLLPVLGRAQKIDIVFLKNKYTCVLPCGPESATHLLCMDWAYGPSTLVYWHVDEQLDI